MEFLNLIFFKSYHNIILLQKILHFLYVQKILSSQKYCYNFLLCVYQLIYFFLFFPLSSIRKHHRYVLKAHIDALLIFTQHLRKELRCKSIEFEAKQTESKGFNSGSHLSLFFLVIEVVNLLNLYIYIYIYKDSKEHA